MRDPYPSASWLSACRKSFDKHRGPCKRPATSAGPSRTFVVTLWKQRYTAKQAGKLTAFLAKSEELGNLSPFDNFHKEP